MFRPASVSTVPAVIFTGINCRSVLTVALAKRANNYMQVLHGLQ